MTDRTCLHCVHMELDYEADWSDITPGEGLTIACGKGYWCLGERDQFPVSRRGFRQSIQAATQCKDFEEEQPSPPSPLAIQAAKHQAELDKASEGRQNIIDAAVDELLRPRPDPRGP